jgi:hypothetical protein
LTSTYNVLSHASAAAFVERPSDPAYRLDDAQGATGRRGLGRGEPDPRPVWEITSSTFPTLTMAAVRNDTDPVRPAVVPSRSATAAARAAPVRRPARPNAAILACRTRTELGIVKRAGLLLPLAVELHPVGRRVGLPHRPFASRTCLSAAAFLSLSASRQGRRFPIAWKEETGNICIRLVR